MNAGIAAQCFACISANLAGFVAGTILGWSTSVIPMLQHPDSLGKAMSSDQIGWIVSILGLGAIIGPITTCLLIDRIGRKSTLIVSTIPMILSYVIMAIRADYPFLLIGRSLAGGGVAIFMSTGPLYIGEVAENKVRGAMGVLSGISMSLGSLFVYVLGPYVTVNGLNMVCGSVAMGLAFFLIFIPESPYYYLMKGDTEKARSSLMWLRRNDNVKTELKTIKAYVEKKKMQTSSAFDLLTKSGNRRAMTIIVILQLMQPFSGSLAISTYAYDIFQDSGYDISPYTLVITMGVVTLIASFGGVFSVDALGRRPVLLFGTTTMFLCLLVLGSFYTLQAQNYDVSSITWMPFMAVMGYMVSDALGLHSLPFVLLSEYFSTNVKAKASMIFTILLFVGATVSLKMFQSFYDSLGLGTTFFICSTVLFSSAVVLFFIMPETKGCSLQKIESMHSGESLNQMDISNTISVEI